MLGNIRSAAIHQGDLHKECGYLLEESCSRVCLSFGSAASSKHLRHTSDPQISGLTAVLRKEPSISSGMSCFAAFARVDYWGQKVSFSEPCLNF
jgi:hypothetical protein